MTVKLEDVTVEDGNWKQISLLKLTGCNIVDIQGYVSKEFGDPMFHVSRIILDNGEKLWVNGEHDIAYIEDSPEDLNLDEDTLEDLYRQENPDEYEDEDYD